ncbi:MAG: copper resistance system multicopper oxidase [Pseudomonadota bacterium]
MYTINRRSFIAGGLSLALPLPGWATSTVRPVSRDRWHLRIAPTLVKFDGRRGRAQGVNGTVPGPLVRLREGDRVRLAVTNALDEDSSIHWHGLLLPWQMDGVPGVSFDGIRPGETFDYEFTVRQHGTYWYHSHSGFQEQTGVYGPLVIDPRDADPVDYDREHIVLLSDWTFEHPKRVLANLKMADDYYNPNRLAVSNFSSTAGDRRVGAGLADRLAWARMRMTMTDIADVTGKTYTYLMNGLDAAGNWSGQFQPGERVRLRIINGSAMSFFNVRIPGAEMTVVQADGQNVEPVTVDEFQIGTAETYDVIVRLEDHAYTLMAESMDRSGYVRGTLSPQPGMMAEVPPLRSPPVLTMQDMGHPGHDNHGATSSHRSDTPDHAHRDHHKSTRTNRATAFLDEDPVRRDFGIGPGVANLNDAPFSRLDHPGIGLDDVSHRTLRYSQVKSLVRNKDPRNPSRVLELHLTGNMHRYMWSFDGRRFSEVAGPIELTYGERLRMILVNNTMMAHPIHLHGLFFELVNGNGPYNPRKNVINVKPAERLAVDITADEPGPWAFHCHLLYHMKAGMMRIVRVSEPDDV